LVLLARTNEDEAVEPTPEVVWAAVAAAKPQLVPIVYDVEDVQAAIGTADGFHGDEHPLVLRLVLVLETQLGTHLCGTELEATLESAVADVLVGGAVLEAELGDRDEDEVELRFR